MTEPRSSRLVAVYPTRAAAERIAEELVDRGTDPRLIKVDDRDDEYLSLEAEMREETDESVPAPASPPATKEMTRGAVWFAVVGGLIGAAIAAPFAFIDTEGLSFWWRLLVAVVVGATAGSTIGVIVGAGMGAKGPAEVSAAQRGTTLSVASTDEEIRAALTSGNPIRIDLVSGAVAVGTVQTEEDRREDRGAVPEIKDHFQQPTGGRWDAVREPHRDT